MRATQSRMTPGGQRVIFVHGSPCESSNWRSYLAEVPEGYEFITVDRLGFGFTTPVRSEASLEQQAAAIRPLVESDDGRRSILVGWSYGGPMIARAAVDFPDQIAGLIIVAGALDPELEKVKWYQRLGCVWPITRFLRDSWRIANEELIPLRGELEKMAEGLQSVTAPVHILHGKRDQLVPFANAAYMQAAFESSVDLQLTTYEEESHFIPFSQFDDVMQAIQAMAERDRQTAGIGLPAAIRPACAHPVSIRGYERQRHVNFCKSGCWGKYRFELPLISELNPKRALPLRSLHLHGQALSVFGL